VGGMYMLLHWIVSALSLMLTAYLVKGFEVKSFGSALITAVVIGLANVLIWPFLMFLTLPINILTLGLFTFVVNGMVLKICAAVLPGFRITSWAAAIFGAIVLSLVGAGLHYVLV
jgi:putative membrane protein